jgi:uncharacterized protein YcfJ
MKQSRKPLYALAIAGGVTLAALAPNAGAQVSTWATVTDARPIYSQINDPQQRCWTERVTDTTVMRLDEAPIGARGQVIERRGEHDLLAMPQTRDIQRCTTVDATRQQLQGYEVHYQYGGREYTTQLPYDPGQRIRVNVDVQPESR